jgi:hypothetical protein
MMYVGLDVHSGGDDGDAPDGGGVARGGVGSPGAERRIKGQPEGESKDGR